MNFPQDKELITKVNGFVNTKAKDVVRFFMYGSDFIRIHGETIASLEGPQTVTEDCVVMFDDYGKLIGYPAEQKAFAKYEIINHIPGAEGKAVKKDATIYVSKKMDVPFSAVIWNGSTLQGKVGDYLVANPDADDFRVIEADVFTETYEVV